MPPSSDSARRHLEAAFTHWQAGRLDDALAACEAALAAQPDHPDALAHAGTLRWLRDDDLAAARDGYLRALAVAPRHVGVLLNLAALAHDVDDLDDESLWLARADTIAPGRADVTWRRSLVELARGEYEEGWRHYEAGLHDPALRGAGPGFPTSPWDGRPCDRLLLWHEQGYGDSIQFVRYARACKSRAREVIVLCPRPLAVLLATCPGVDRVVDEIGPGDFDEHVPLLSLPHRFATSLATIPAETPYLFADAARVARWSDWLAQRTRAGVARVGLVWSGNVRADQPRFRAIDRRRSIAFAQFAAITTRADVEVVSLQAGEPCVEAAGSRLVDPMASVHDFADTAAIVTNLDLVITVDTAVAHLAGALGAPVWILSRRDACWRWLRNRRASPWYPTATVFGQRTRSDWKPVVADVTEALARFVTTFATER